VLARREPDHARKCLDAAARSVGEIVNKEIADSAYRHGSGALELAHGGSRAHDRGWHAREIEWRWVDRHQRPGRRACHRCAGSPCDPERSDKSRTDIEPSLHSVPSASTTGIEQENGRHGARVQRVVNERPQSSHTTVLSSRSTVVSWCRRRTGLVHPRHPTLVVDH
jgi:hypothetical protein